MNKKINKKWNNKIKRITIEKQNFKGKYCGQER